MSYRDALGIGETNVGMGMVPHKKNCRCDECRVEQLERQLAEANSKLNFCYCAYCGERFPVNGDVSDVSEHIRTCVKHPMRAVEAKLAEAVARIKELEGALDTIEAWSGSDASIEIELIKLYAAGVREGEK